MISAVVVLAAGSGKRVGADVNKALLPVAQRPLLTWSVADAIEVSDRRVVVVAAADEIEQVTAALADHVDAARFEVISGGADRHASEWAAIEHLRPEIERGDIDIVAIHDGARPLAGGHLFRSILAAADRHGGAVPVVAKPALVAASTQPRSPSKPVAGVQTPQAFRARVLLDAYEQAAAESFTGTDTASSIARYSGPGVMVAAVPGSARNLKVTFAEDIAAAERLLSNTQTT